MAQRLAHKLLEVFQARSEIIRVVDPFGGDGRLLGLFVENAAKNKRLRAAKWHFELWDNDGDCLAEAKTNLAHAVRAAKFNATIRAHHRDTFLESSEEFGAFDLVITNPPWESLKPDSRELRGLSGNERRSFEAGLRDYDKRLAACLPNSQPTTKLYGWGTNLSRCGLEASVNLLRPDGCCGIVLPSSVLADQVSAPLRKWVLRQTAIRSIDHYPAEAKPFEKVDQPCVFTIIQRSEHPGLVQPVITRHDRARQEIASERIRLTADDLKVLEFRFPTELSEKELALLLKLSRFRPLSDWEMSRGGKLWMGRELDETDYASFVSPVGEFAFAKGRNVNRFTPIDPLKEFVKTGAREIPKSAHFQRVAWRDVSRRSQTRRIVATIIPSGVVTGNSLHVAYFVDGDPMRLQALLGVLNSLAFEFQLRSRLGTGHISLGSVRGVHVPDFDDASFVRKISRFAQRALSGDPSAEIEIEAAIADALSLSQQERDALVNHFIGLQSEFSDELRRALKLGINGKERRR